jgi:hypothetical protein
MRVRSWLCDPPLANDQEPDSERQHSVRLRTFVTNKPFQVNDRRSWPLAVGTLELGARGKGCGYSEVLNPDGLQMLLTGKHTLVSNEGYTGSTVNIRVSTNGRLSVIRLSLGTNFGRLQPTHRHEGGSKVDRASKLRVTLSERLGGANRRAPLADEERHNGV